MIVDSGRGWHGYWILRPYVRLEGVGRCQNASTVVGINRELADRLSGDAVGDLARVMRLPGSVNGKNGRPCRLLYSGGDVYRLQDLAGALGIDGSVPRRKAVRVSLTPQEKTGKPGRPRLGATKRDLRSLPPWARDLVVGGAWRAGKRYKVDGRVDRSRADLAAIGAMVKGGWSDEKILAAFSRPDWLYRLGIGNSEKNDELRMCRVKKMISKSIGLLYYNLSTSKDPTSVLYSPILGPDDLDTVGEEF